MSRVCLCCAAFAAVVSQMPAAADPWLAPGDTGLRSDLATLADAGVLRSPITTWPLPWGEIAADLNEAAVADLDGWELLALERVRGRAKTETRVGEWAATVRASASESPTVVRAFASTPRSEGEIGAGVVGVGDRFAIRLQAVRAWRAGDGDTVRLDGSYLGMALGNWMVSAGYPERWWGPSWDGSLILSTNARPPPQIAVNRNFATPFEQRWLRWLGPWTVTAFLGQLDDDGRVIDDPLLLGMRVAAKPLPQFEFALSRAAQLCGDGRTCDERTLFNVLVGRDNGGVNVDEDEEPGNQLGGFDLRWALPFDRVPTAVYAQWIGEDTRQGGPQIGSWLREVGVEFSGAAFREQWRHRSWFELADTVCREGGGGFGGAKFGCAYEHFTYQTGFRYKARSIAHSIDSDGTSLSVGSMLLREDREWRFSARHAELNRSGGSNHPLTLIGQDFTEIALEHSRPLGAGTIRLSLGTRSSDGPAGTAIDGRSVFGGLEFVLN